MRAAPGSQVYSLEPYLQHELAHAVGGLAKAGYHTGIEEGTAMAFGDDQLWPTFDPREIAVVLENHDRSRRLETEYYALVGHFVSFLRRVGGDAGVAELWFSSRHDPARWPELRTRIEDIFARDFDDIVGDYLATYPQCDPSRYRDNGLDCGVADFVVPSDGTTVEKSVAMGCGLDHVRGQSWARWTTLAFDISVGGRYVLEIRNRSVESGGHVWLRKCGQSCADDPAEVFDFDTPVVPDDRKIQVSCAEVGRYRLGLVASDDAVFDLRLWRNGVDAPECGQ
ncbi:MAG TPA: hypothetical protein VG755_21800 [Nannocystaceae bacterium]|nr:hypothetical protein [Nannocystaceae bacterium]